MTTPNHYTIKRARRYEAGGEALTLTEWARRAGVSTETFRARFRRRIASGWGVEDALLRAPKNDGGSRVGTGLKRGLASFGATREREVGV